MLVIAASDGGAGLRWSGRRHDDDAPGASRGDTLDGLFAAVFGALHDGEQVAVGFPGPLTAAADADPDAALAAAEQDSADVRQLAALLGELGHWRSWTVVSTSLPRWRATTSVLIWATGSGELDDAVEQFYGAVRNRAERGSEVDDGAVVNLAAVAARRAQLTIDPAQLSEPVVSIATT